MKKIEKNEKWAVAISIALSVIGCSSNDSTSNDSSTTTASATVPTVFSSNYKTAVTLSSDGTSVTMKSNGTPDHVTPYWGIGNTLYEEQTAGQTVNPGNLESQVFVMTIPINPVASSTKEETSLGPIGMALNGVAIYNDREGGNVPVDSGTLKSFDRAGAHSGPGGLYHYHFNGDFTSDDDAKLIGWLRDGFPIYGRQDKDSTYPSDLDTNGGHTGETTDYPNGIYHYHCSNINYMDSGFYVLKSGSYYGTKGTFTFKTTSILVIATITFSCNKATKEDCKLPSSFIANTTMIPKDTILSENKNLKLENGIYFLNEKAYSGYIKEMHNEKQIKNIFSFLNGQQQGLSIAYFANGQKKDSRSYKEGKSYGRHFGYWENGHQKYDFLYVNDKREGLQKQWYESGTPYSYLTFKDDKEDGMQKAWRQNGKPYINYQVKEGRRYGLQKSNLCYTLRDGELKTKK